MFTNNFKLDGIENILDEIGYLSEEAKDENDAGEKAGEKYEDRYKKKSGKKSKDYDGDGTVEDETDEYAGVKDRAIKKAMKKEEKETEKEGKEKESEKEGKESEKEGKDEGGKHKEYKHAPGKEEKGEKKTEKESVDFSSVLDELTEEDLLFLSDDLIEEVVEEFFYETLEEGFEVDELETILLEQVESELTYLEEAKVTVGHDSDVKPEASRTNKLAKVKDAVKKVASGAKAVAKKVAGAAGEVAGSAVAGYKKASAASQDAPSATKSDRNDSKSDSPNTGTRSSSGATGTKRPGILGRVGAALKSGLKKAIHGAGKVAGKVVKTAKAGYDEGRGKTAPASSSAPAAKPAPKVASPAAKQATAKKKSKSNLDNLLNQIRNEEVENIEEKAPPGAKYERMVKHIKKSYSKGGLTDKERSIAYATAWKAKKANEEVEIEEGLEEACWKGYKAVGMKMKNGKKVPNCVPMEEYVDLERDMLEEGYTFEQVLEVIAAYEDGFEVIFEEDGVTIGEYIDEALSGERYKAALKKGKMYSRKVSADPSKRATRGGRGGESDFGAGDRGSGNRAARRAGTYQEEFVIDEETQFLSDVEMVADWLHAEGVIENEDQFFELMEDLSEEEIEELYDMVLEATAMAKRGYDETAIRNKIAKSTGGGKAADRATALEKRPTYGDKNKEAQRSRYARAQRGDFRNTNSSNPGLHGYGHQSNDPKVKAKQAARGAQRGSAALTPKEKKDLNMGYEMIGNSLEEGGLEVRNYSWKEVMEAQQARNNPEKYEAGEKKKYAPVRGEKTPMPPRGDKRREDFEKWYAANVR